MPFNIQQDYIDPMERTIQKLSSYNKLIPSTDFKDDEYSLYLEYASADELERDIVKEETYQLIMRN
jgi:hypothetical protein